MQDILKVLKDAKVLLATVGTIVVTLVGGYAFLGEYFVTKAQAEEMFQGAQQQINGIVAISQQNTVMILKLSLLRYERIIEGGRDLTPTQRREYDLLKERLRSIRVEWTPTPR